MEEKLFLGLKTGAAQTEADGQVGLLTCYADNARQAAAQTRREHSASKVRTNHF